MFDPITISAAVATASTEIPKVGFGDLNFNPLDPATLGFSPSRSSGVGEDRSSIGQGFGTDSAEFTGAPSLPAAAQGGPSDPGGQFGGFATSVDSPDGLLSLPGQGFNRGGKISFMNIKK